MNVVARNLNGYLGIFSIVVFLSLPIFICKSSFCGEQDVSWYLFPFICFVIFAVYNLIIGSKNIFTTNRTLFTLFLIFVLVNLLRRQIYLDNSQFINSLLVFIVAFILNGNWSNKSTQVFAFMILTTALLEIVISIMQLAHGSTQLQLKGTFVNSADNAQFVVLFIPVCNFLFPYLTVLRRIPALSIKIAVYFSILIIVIAAKSRLGFLSLVLGLFLEYRSILSKRFVIVSLLSLLLGSVAVFFYKVSSSTGRILILETSLANWNSFFPLGLGSSGFYKNYPIWQASFFANHQHSLLFYNAGDVRMSFNEWLLFLAEYGFFWWCIVIVAIIKLLKNCDYSNTKQNFLAAIIIILTLQSLASNIFHITEFSIIYFSSLILLKKEISNNTDESKFNRRQDAVSRMLTGAVCVLICFIAALFFIHDKSLSLWRKFEKENIVASKYDVLNKELYRNEFFLYRYALHLFDENYNDSCLQVLRNLRKSTNSYDSHILEGLNSLSLSNYRDAENSFHFASNYIPHFLYPKYLLMKSSIIRKDTILAKNYAREILNMHPKINSEFSVQLKDEAAKILKY